MVSATFIFSLDVNPLILYVRSMTLGERLAAARKASNLSQKALGELVGLEQQSINAIESGVTSQPRKLNALAEALQVSPLWLQFGVTTAAEPSTAYIIGDSKYAFIPTFREGAGMDMPVRNEHAEISGSHAYRRDWLAQKKLDPAACVVVEASGDAMQPTIFHGDILLVNTLEQRITSGQVYAFNTPDGVQVKRLFKGLDGRIRVVSDNSDKISHPDDHLAPGMESEIIGRVAHRSGSV